MRSKALFILTAIVATIAGLGFVIVRSRPGSTPAVHFIGTAPDGSHLLFGINNSSSKTWNFPGLGPTAPLYRFKTPTSESWIFPPETTPPPPGSKLDRYLLTPHTKITFSVLHPPHGSQSINVAVLVIPGDFSSGEQWIEYLSNRARQLIGKRATNGAALQESGMVTIAPR